LGASENVNVCGFPLRIDGNTFIASSHRMKIWWWCIVMVEKVWKVWEVWEEIKKNIYFHHYYAGVPKIFLPLLGRDYS